MLSERSTSTKMVGILGTKLTSTWGQPASLVLLPPPLLVAMLPVAALGLVSMPTPAPGAPLAPEPGPRRPVPLPASPPALHDAAAASTALRPNKTEKRRAVNLRMTVL